MSTETQIGTIADTKLFQDFHKYVIGKFESMGNFSMIVFDNRRTLCRIENRLDNWQTCDYIEHLQRDAERLSYDKSKVYISEAERLNIYDRVEWIVKSRLITKVQYFSDIHISINTYKQIVNGYKYKNESYAKLTKILFYVPTLSGSDQVFCPNCGGEFVLKTHEYECPKCEHTWSY